eukprot:4389756-Alexandrium_andersonii.AAC.1
MSASLVGSEMCIRDSPSTGGLHLCPRVRQARRGGRFPLPPPAWAVLPCGKRRSAPTCGGGPTCRTPRASEAVLPAGQCRGAATHAT